MDVYFTPEQEARISEAAKANGVDAATLVKDAALQFVDDADFHAAVMEGLACADRGEFIEQDEMDTRFERMLSS